MNVIALSGSLRSGAFNRRLVENAGRALEGKATF